MSMALSCPFSPKNPPFAMAQMPTTVYAAPSIMKVFRAHHGGGVAARRLAGTEDRLLQEQSGSFQVAAAVNVRDGKKAGGRASQARGRGTDFVSQHVETLHEIAIEHYEQARRLGIEDLHIPGSTNTRSARASAGAA
jgi:hypothetical protein